jgi:hypothetical protein
MNTTTAPRPATPWARWTVRLATHGLPVGETRLRYRQELLAELYGMSPAEQSRYAAGLLLSSRSLRHALADDPDLALEGVMTTHHRPLACRLNLHHAWHTEVTEDGVRFRRCRRCGKDDDGISNPNKGTVAPGV